MFLFYIWIILFRYSNYQFPFCLDRFDRSVTPCCLLLRHLVGGEAATEVVAGGGERLIKNG
ncbi:hypothetical protein ZOSMA_13G00850 [Zostera marina]|uniref:Uncharacterized protein n=1 Tax=Zostera marina TaxID=29655 RepID=A0A0K9PXZ0_ZOSMR|nr:hypothetical protein ZOSMA_13G00850 [Zostera marina]